MYGSVYTSARLPCSLFSASATGLSIPTVRLGSAFSLVSHVPGMNRLNVAAQPAGVALAIAGAVSMTPLPATVAVAISATVRRDLERLGMGTSITGRNTWAHVHLHRRYFPSGCPQCADPLAGLTSVIARIGILVCDATRATELSALSVGDSVSGDVELVDGVEVDPNWSLCTSKLIFSWVVEGSVTIGDRHHAWWIVVNQRLRSFDVEEASG